MVSYNDTQRIEIGFIPSNNVIVIKLDVLTSYTDPSKICFLIENSEERTISPKIEVDVTSSYAFRAPQDDYYYLVLDNTPETLEYPAYNFDKTVLLQINYKGESDLILLILGIPLLLIGIALTALYLFKLRPIF